MRGEVWRLILVKILNLLFKLYSDGVHNQVYLTEQFHIIILYYYISESYGNSSGIVQNI